MRNPPAALDVANIFPYSIFCAPRFFARSFTASVRPMRTSPASTLVGACPCPIKRGVSVSMPLKAFTSVVVEPISATRISINIEYLKFARFCGETAKTKLRGMAT